MSLTIVRTVEALRAQVSAWHEAGKTVGVVPTMGALHAGHMTLVDTARAECDRVIVTLFVNPKQFNNPDDLKAYPRTEAEDAARLEHGGVDLLYAPDGAGMYPEGFSTNISVAGVSEGLCGAFRPGHFDGVATVVTKLLLQTQADRAYFGEKDFQQLAVIKRLVADLDIPVHIIGVPTVREADGLALSSRNVRLSPKGRAIAPALAKALAVAAASIKGGARVEPVVNVAIESLVKAGFESVEYFELRDAETLAPVDNAERPARLLAAAWLDGVRLIDNLAVQPDL